MVDYRKHEILTGLFIIAAILVFALFSFKVGGLDLLKPFRGRTLACWSDFPDVKGLEVSANVLAGGRKVGRVTAIELAGPEALKDGGRLVRVHYEIHDLDLPLDRDSATASVVRDGFIGTFFLKLEVGDFEDGIPRPIREQSGLPDEIEIKSGVEEGFEDLMSKASPLIEKAEKLLDQADEMMTILNTEILKDTRNSPDVISVPEILDQVSGLMEDGRDFVRRVDRMLTDTEYADGVHQQIVKPIGELVRNADKSVTEITSALVDRTLRNADAAIVEGQAAIKDARRALDTLNGMLDTNAPKVNAIVSDLETTMGTVKGKIEDLTSEMDEILNQITGTIRDNRADLRTIVRRIRKTMWELEIASRKLRANPAVVIWGDDEEDLSVDPVDESGIRRSGRAKPYDQRDEEDDK